MGDPGKKLPDNRDFSVPFLLISAVFFSLYLFRAAEILANLIPGSPNIFIHEPGFTYMFNGLFFFAILMVASFSASIFLVRKLKKRSLYWQAGLPLCIVIGIIATSLVIFTFFESSNPALRSLGNALTGEIIGYAILPASAVYFLVFWKKTFGNISGNTITISSVIGVIGVMFLVYVLYSMITYLPPQAPIRYDIFQFTPNSLIALVCAFFYGSILLPVIGFTFLKLGFACRKKPTEPEKALLPI